MPETAGDHEVQSKDFSEKLYNLILAKVVTLFKKLTTATD